MRKTIKNKFKPRNPQKYNGDPTNIIYRSGWECKFMMYLDNHPDVLEWSSEEHIIPYLSPKDNQYHRYFPDFVIKIRERTGKIEIKMIEIKPKKQTVPPKIKKSKSKRYITEVLTWGINNSKWQAANKYCEKKGWKFVILTEDDLKV